MYHGASRKAGGVLRAVSVVPVCDVLVYAVRTKLVVAAPDVIVTVAGLKAYWTAGVAFAFPFGLDGWKAV